MLGLLRNSMNDPHKANDSWAAVDAIAKEIRSAFSFLTIYKAQAAGVTATSRNLSCVAGGRFGPFIRLANRERDIIEYRQFSGQDVHWCFASIGCGSHHPMWRWSGQGATHGKNSYNHRGC
jgi:hypothetical protein